jgi:hypothetical protein
MSGERSTVAMLMDHVPGARALGTSLISTIGLSTSLKSSCLKAGATTKVRNLRLGVRCIRSGASRDRHGDVMWLDFRAPRHHLVVDVTVTHARTSTNTLHIGARLPLPGNLAFGAQQSKLDADLRTSALLGTPLV